MHWLRSLATLLVLTAVCVRPAAAHPAPFSYLDVRFSSSGLSGTLVLHDFDLAHELVTIRVNELGSSPCPRCGQAGYLDPAMSSRRGSLTTWITVAAVIALVSLVAALS